MKATWMAAVLTLAAALPAAGGQMYKWTDADGKVHYSDQQPPTSARKQETMKPHRSPVSIADTAPGNGADQPDAVPASAGPKTPAEQEMEFRKRRVEAAEAEARRQKEAQAAADKQRNCTHARNNLAALERGGRITRTDAGGEQVFMSDAEIAAEMPNARQIADSWCK
ncbi:MAG: DUF4124 domain-containing protein [Burkholderiales bacterium]|nr:DUF4124 domain-containing protein [Burkholderiales bacterium]